MILVWLIVILLVGGLLSAAATRASTTLSRAIALVAVLADLALTLYLWLARAYSGARIDVPWLPQFGIHFHLAADGLSVLMLLLTFFLGAVAVLASWTEITDAVGFFHLNLLWTLAGIAGVFLAMDLFLFYFAWELMLVPMYFLIAVWGHENRVYAAVKFFIFTQLSGLLMLVAILSLYFLHHRATGVYTFAYADLLGTALPPGTQMWLMLGFFAAFAVKLPVVPLHTWLPDAHTEAPTAGSVLLAGLLLKTGAYGMLRFVLPLFPGASHAFAPVAMVLGVIGILYGALMAFSQTDLKRLVAYTSVSHLGFVLLGIFAWNELALQGAVVTMVCHGISTGALFVIAGLLQQRMHTRELVRMGGLWSTAPRLSGSALFFALASLGLPGLGDFIGEFLVLLGTWQRSIPLAAIAAVGVLAATFYALRLVQAAFHGPNVHNWRFSDLVPREAAVIGVMAATLLWLGLYPQPVIATFQTAVTRLDQYAIVRLNDAR
jgi:NADH-quinone oxidoreductase subunit M